MSKKGLVTYASKYGSTREVAEFVAARLREGGFEVDDQPIKKVRRLEQYDFIVLGTPIYFGALQKDALTFLNQNQETIVSRSREGLRMAFFTLGPMHNDEKEWQGSRTLLDKEMEKFSWFHPASIEMFGGKYDPTKLRFPDTLIAALPASPLHDLPASDARDWQAIRAWASILIEQLQPAVVD